MLSFAGGCSRSRMPCLPENRGRDDVNATRGFETGEPFQLGRFVVACFKHAALGQCPRYGPGIETTACLSKASGKKK